MTLADWANTIYGYFFVIAATGLGTWKLFQHGVHNSVEAHFIELREEIKPMLEMVTEIDLRTSKIEYALYNEGKTGIVNKVDSLLERQQEIKIDVEVLKAKSE